MTFKVMGLDDYWNRGLVTEGDSLAEAIGNATKYLEDYGSLEIEFGGRVIVTMEYHAE